MGINLHAAARGLTFLSVLLICASHVHMPEAVAGNQVIKMPLNEWKFSSRGNFQGRIDRRNLYQIVHPQEPASSGDYGRIEKEVILPEGMKPPYTLRFYVSDNIYGEAQSGVVDIRKDHRFKQVLIDGKVVWSKDIFFNTPLSNPEYICLDVTQHVSSGRKFKLAFQLRQEVDSSVTMPGDRIKLGVYAGTTTPFTPLPKEEYSTWSYWGDFEIISGNIESIDKKVVPWQSQLKVREPHLEYRVTPVNTKNLSLKVENRNLLSGKWSWPVSQGIPMPMGALKDVSKMALLDFEGRQSAADFVPLNRWPDGSLRWVLLDTNLPAGTSGIYQLRYGNNVRATKVSVRNEVNTTADKWEMENGIVRVKWIYKGGKPDNLEIGLAGGKTIISGQYPYMESKGRNFRAVWKKGKWISVSPLRAEMEVEGELISDDGYRYGSCRMRIAMHANSPLLRVLYTIVNELGEPVPEDVPDKERVRATGGLVGGTRPLTAIIDKYGLKLLTDVDDVSQSEKGWIDVKSKNGWVTGTIRYFQHIWPIGLTADSDGIDFKLFKEGDARNPKYATYPGEAKTHEIWLALSDKFPGKDAGQALADLAETPPRFDTSGLIRESYVWGEMPYVGDSDNTEIYTLLIEKVLDPYYRETLKGIRHFGGYTGGLNFYWNGLDSMYKLYAMTGERKWYDMAERSIRHYMDICTIHWSPDGSKVGGKNRSVDKFLAVYLVHQNTQPLFSHWNMTGDPEGYRLGRANADFIMNDKEMIMLTEQRADRQQGWPLMSMVRAWQETGDPAYEKHARRIVDIALGYMEQRRGAYLRVHGSTSHMGIVPFMSGILASGLRHYHLWSGDERAGIAVAQIAQSVNAEMHDPYYSRTKPDLDYYYSPNPYLKGRDGKTLITSLNHNIVSAQAYAAYITGDPGLADIAWRSWRAYVQNGQWGTRSYLYDLHAAVYWLAKAPVPERTLDVKVNSLWRYEAGAEEIWLQHKEKSPLKLRVRWTVYEQPYQRGQDVRNLKDYVKKRGLKGDLLLLNADGRVVSSVSLDFAAKPNGTVVDIEVPDALQGFYRLVSRGAEALPVQLILQDIVPRTAGWGLPLDRGYLNAGKEFFFHVPPGLNELDMMCDLIAPWEKSTVSVFDETGRKVEEVTFPGGKKFEWKVKLPAGSSGKLWRIVLEGSLNILLRIKDVNMVGLKEDAIFHISERPAPYMSATLDLPGGFTGKSVNVPAGEYLKVERGEKKEEYLYKNVNAKEGTIEFWMKVNADEESILHIPILSFGRMSLYHRGLVGAYYNLDKGFLQSGFIFRRGVWYHVALTWDLGSETRTPSMNLFVDGVSIMGRMQTPLPVGVGDWTGSELKIGSIVPVSISGLRIFSVSRNEKSKDVIIGEASGKDVLYRQ